VDRVDDVDCVDSAPATGNSMDQADFHSSLFTILFFTAKR